MNQRQRKIEKRSRMEQVSMFSRSEGKIEFQYGAHTESLFTAWVRDRRGKGEAFTFSGFFNQLPAEEQTRVIISKT